MSCIRVLSGKKFRESKTVFSEGIGVRTKVKAGDEDIGKTESRLLS